MSRRDLAAYPRDEAADARFAEAAGVDVLFAPSGGRDLSAGLRHVGRRRRAGEEGAARAGHFRGVATVCVKLFDIVRPRRAYFGQKDAQQAIVVRRVVRDLNLDVQIRVLPTVRDEDGLALSSRNARLSREERAASPSPSLGRSPGAEAHVLGGDAVAATRAALNGLTPDYVELLDLDGVTILASAARVGDGRLIDNVILEGELT